MDEILIGNACVPKVIHHGVGVGRGGSDGDWLGGAAAGGGGEGQNIGREIGNGGKFGGYTMQMSGRRGGGGGGGGERHIARLGNKMHIGLGLVI
ncbi:hypothetical protein CASFOL_019423 [Castilleja foliolosa]|uniref:Uncharacterized protein n=1 Tax=Castilleja foliolosa TaxID=1961234 RepID=A0ABD3D5K7_9LAMI